MIILRRTTSSNPDFTALIRLLDADLLQRYQELQAQYDRHNKIEANETVIIAYFDNQPVGCACMKQMDDRSMELKRMYVDPAVRGQGIGRSIVSELCAWASELGFVRMVLELGDRQPEALTLYKKSGFTGIPNYPPYTGMEHSICMAKELTPAKKEAEPSV